MDRLFLKTLLEWKSSPARKPLLLQGARQVGKTWILKTFGEQQFQHYLILDFARNPELAGFFDNNLQPKRILTDLGVYLNRDIDLANTLLVFDEIQQCPKALTSLKYFSEELPEAYLCASGSLLGLGLSEQNFPVGKIRREWLRPMSFEEFLMALGESSLRQSLAEAAGRRSAISSPIHQKTFSLFKEYLITGGMPEVVSAYIALRETRVAAFHAVRDLQKNLTESYLDDIAKHSGSIKAIHIAALFKNIPLQLARETTGIRKFLFKDVLSGRSSYDQLEGPIQWLDKAGLVHRIPICRAVKMPLAAHAEENAFMLYLFDVGILGSMLRLDPGAIYQNEVGQFKGFLMENAVLNEMIFSGAEGLCTWRHNTAEIEFLMASGEAILPIEVKAGMNTKAKSLKIFREKFKPARSLLFSGVGCHQEDEGLLHAPVYLAADVIREIVMMKVG